MAVLGTSRGGDGAQAIVQTVVQQLLRRVSL
ncbi:hypothetical protein EV699_1385 [Plasticicumulans lactativorans]|uniref:Uncharacterized protein n=1 Tax=Plasticicumulans lactativorans TaxID=1133106 RepID=A0A4R2KNQ4_9GAMM|nr:hypothetical protein EV699_1385 [Plasticicumulans lactativorans]